MDSATSTSGDDSSSSRGEPANGRKRRPEYPSPPRYSQPETESEDGIDTEEGYGSLLKRRRTEYYSNSDEEDSDSFDDEDEDDDESSRDIDIAEEFPSSDSEDNGAGRRGRGGGRGRGGRKGRGGSRALNPNHGGDEIHARSQSENFGRRPNDNQNSRKKRKAPKDQYEETPELRQIMARATNAWMVEDYETALEYILEAVKLQPEAFHLHGRVAEILVKLERHQDSIDALFSGVHASKDPNNWRFVVDRLREIGPEIDDKTIKAKLLRCYSAILQIDQKDYDARFARMHLYREKELHKRARNDCLQLLKAKPTDADVVEALAELTVILDDPKAAIDCFSIYMETVLQTENPENTSLTFNILSSYTNMLLDAEMYEKGLHELRSIARWILGRGEETYWDKFDDDREWDVYSDPRRNQAKEFEFNKFDETAYGLGLPLELRVRLGSLRILSGEGQFVESMVSFADNFQKLI
jgi:general transcription factor 3C polypeptide 3 (transcription factor C subunit 4)